MSGSYVADCFAGCGVVSKKVRAAGFAAREWELLNSPAHDLCKFKVRAPIVADLTLGRCIGLMLAPPCSSWSVARDRTYPIRNVEHPMGIPGLSEKDNGKLKIGNDTMNAAVASPRPPTRPDGHGFWRTLIPPRCGWRLP